MEPSVILESARLLDRPEVVELLIDAVEEYPVQELLAAAGWLDRETLVLLERTAQASRKGEAWQE